MERPLVTLKPSTVVNNHNHGALVTITASLALIASLLFYIARLTMRWPWKALLSKDDIAITAATVRTVLKGVTFDGPSLIRRITGNLHFTGDCGLYCGG